MILMLCRNRVNDFDRWKSVFDSHADLHQQAGLKLRHVWREIDGGDNVCFLFEVRYVEMARAFISAPEAGEAAKASGVVEGEYYFVEEIPASGP